MDSHVIEKAADTIRVLSAAMVEKAASGHPGGAMGGADFVNILYTEFLRYDPDDMTWPFRDRFFLDPGHMSSMLYAVLTLLGHYSIDEIKEFRQLDSPTPGHPELDCARGIENTSGPLGLGHAMALGAAIAERFFVSRFGEWCAHKTYAYVSDGGIQEEISQGVGRLAGHLGLANFILFYDSNDIQLSHPTESTSSEDTARKYEAWGWRVETIDGNNAQEIRAALKRAGEEKQRPTLIIGKTIMGKGAVDMNGESYERQCATHGMPLSKAGASYEKTIRNLHADPQNPFTISYEVLEFYNDILEKKRKEARAHKETQAQWEKKNSSLAAKLNRFLENDIPEIEYSSIQQKPGCATRAASAEVLSVFAEKIENMFVSSADLSVSDNTDSFLNKVGEFKKGDFSGRFLHAGVSELTMAAIMNGMALHGGMVPACGTFFVFSDYMKPAVRIAALMGLAVKYIWTHDSFRVGEDGPTHQPIEHEAQIRLLEKINNFSGQKSVLVLRPADAAETTVAWKMAIENNNSPTALILTRQGVPELPSVNSAGGRYSDALYAEKGAYVVMDTHGQKPDLVLVGNGSEVSLLCDTAQMLADKNNLKIRVVSVISEGRFREQDTSYQELILPFGIPAFGLTAGLPDSLQGLTGPLGEVIGMKRFGASAPFKKLEEKFGYTPEIIFTKALAYLQRYKNMVSKIKALQ